MIQTADELLRRLNPVTGPELTPVPPPSPLTWWIAATLVGLLLVGIVLFWRRRGILPSILADVEARKALAGVSLNPNAAELIRLDRLARRYLGRVYHIPAQRLTTPELLAALPSGIAPSWAEVFEPCDRARFAGVLPTQAAWSAMLNRAASMIQADGV